MIAGVFSVIMLISVFLGILMGWQLNNMRQAQVRRWERKELEEAEAAKAKGTKLYEVMSSFSNELEQSVRDLYEHAPDCMCAYCQIKFGRDPQTLAAAAPDDQPYHPAFVRAIMLKNKDLSASLKMMQAEIDKRDRARALEYRKDQRPMVADPANESPEALAG